MLGSDHLTSRGGGGGLVRLEYFFGMFAEPEFFFSTIEGWNIFFPMYDARSNFFYCTVRMNNDMY